MAICIVLFIILDYPSSHMRQTTMIIGLPTDVPSPKGFKFFNMQEILADWKKKGRSFVNFNLTGDTAFDNITLYAIEYRTRKLKLGEDTIHVLKIHFAPEVNYGQFVRLVNAMHIEMQPCYSINSDDFYIWEQPPTRYVASTEIPPLEL